MNLQTSSQLFNIIWQIVTQPINYITVGELEKKIIKTERKPISPTLDVNGSRLNAKMIAKSQMRAQQQIYPFFSKIKESDGECVIIVYHYHSVAMYLLYKICR